MVPQPSSTITYISSAAGTYIVLKQRKCVEYAVLCFLLALLSSCCDCRVLALLF